MNSVPNCVVFPSASGSLSNCIALKLPSTGTLVAVFILLWIIYLVVAYVIYYFLKKFNPDQKINYWIIFGILIISNILVSLLFGLGM